MTKEEQSLLRERRKILAGACREAGKRRGWRTAAREQYQVRDGMLYALSVSLPSYSGGRELGASLRCKPLVLDEMFWRVFHMEETAAKRPFSFHLNGAYAAPCLRLPPWGEPLDSPEELESAVENIFDWTEFLAAENTFPDPGSYLARLEAEMGFRTLDTVLCLLCEGDYPQAVEVIEAGLARGENGGFLRQDGRRSILEDARDYCAARLEEP